METKQVSTSCPCPNCGRMINLEAEILEGQRVTCSKCGVELEVINLEPPEVDWMFGESQLDWGAEDTECV